MDDRGPVVLAVTAAMMAGSTLFVVLRLLTRYFIVHRIKLDDWLILFAWVIAFGLSFCICYATTYGLGRHQVAVSAAHEEVLQRLEYTFSVLYNPALMVTKSSIGVFYLSLSHVRPVFRNSVLFTMAIVNIAGLALSLLNIFQCRPLDTLFADPRPDNAKCIDIITLYLSSAPVNILTDLMLLLLPLPMLQSMHLPKKQKIILYITFGFGIFVTAVDIVRISYLQQATQSRLRHVLTDDNPGESVDSSQDTDFSWYASLSFMWTAIEVNVGIMCASVPHLKPLVAKYTPKMLKGSGDITPIPTPPRRRSVMTLGSSEMQAAHRVPSATGHIAVPRAGLHPLQNYNFSTMGEGTVRRASADSDMRMEGLHPLQTHDTSLREEEEERYSNDTEGQMTFMDMITTPGQDEMPRARRTDTMVTNQSFNTPGSAFNFVNVAESKSFVYMTNKESFKPIANVTFLFLLWGFAYGLLNTLNGRFQVVAHMSSGQTVAQHSIYYVGYFFGPLTLGRYVLKNWGFKACYMVGLMIYGTGTLVFWPAAVLTSFAAFFISNLIVGFGLSILETAANPFIALCGPPRYMEVRLNLSQGVQAIGTIMSPLLAQKALFGNKTDASSLIDTQWTYLAIALATWILGFVYYVVQLPEATDAELEAAARSVHKNNKLDELRANWTIAITLGLGVFAQFLYVGVQEAVATSLGPYLTQIYPAANPINYAAYGHTLFAVSRFLGAGLGLFIKPRYLILVFLLGCILFSALAMSLTSVPASAMILIISFFEGPLFALIFAIPLRGLGKHTKTGAVLLTAGISGGAIFDPIQWAVADSHGYKYSYSVVIATFAFATIFAVYLNLSPRAREQVDPPAKDTFLLPSAVGEVHTTPEPPMPELKPLDMGTSPDSGSVVGSDVQAEGGAQERKCSGEVPTSSFEHGWP